MLSSNVIILPFAFGPCQTYVILLRETRIKMNCQSKYTTYMRLKRILFFFFGQETLTLPDVKIEFMSYKHVTFPFDSFRLCNMEAAIFENSLHFRIIIFVNV